MAHTSLKVVLSKDWYMIGENKFLHTLKSYTSSHVNFGNGTKGKILEIRNLVINESPKLDNVLWVKRSNLQLD